MVCSKIPAWAKFQKIWLQTAKAEGPTFCRVSIRCWATVASPQYHSAMAPAGTSHHSQVHRGRPADASDPAGSEA
jgi:hypothetical protein